MSAVRIEMVPEGAERGATYVVYVPIDDREEWPLAFVAATNRAARDLVASVARDLIRLTEAKP